MCPATVPNVDKASSSVSNTWYGSSAGYTCHSGYEFPDGESSKFITCQADGSWSSKPENCQSKCLYKMYYRLWIFERIFPGYKMIIDRSIIDYIDVSNKILESCKIPG